MERKKFLIQFADGSSRLIIAKFDSDQEPTQAIQTYLNEMQTQRRIFGQPFSAIIDIREVLPDDLVRRGEAASKRYHIEAGPSIHEADPAVSPSQSRPKGLLRRVLNLMRDHAVGECLWFILLFFAASAIKYLTFTH
jgi:hypothetical protein